MNIYTYCIIALCGALLWAATGCGDGSSTKDDELFWCKYDNQVLRVDWLEDEEIPASEWPEKAFCCKATPLAVLDVDQIVEGMRDDMFEDFEDHLSGLRELQAALDVFAEANKDVVAWHVDYKRAVLIPKQEDK